ncbi:protein SSUH2 homolog [Ptychodera flava]|uniref:protein SSUH2 homolog n=1 Tax=Ptychodera flava TaxID=63121 RepID=UPI00396A5B1F
MFVICGCYSALEQGGEHNYTRFFSALCKLNYIKVAKNTETRSHIEDMSYPPPSRLARTSNTITGDESPSMEWDGTSDTCCNDNLEVPSQKAPTLESGDSDLDNDQDGMFQEDAESILSESGTETIKGYENVILREGEAITPPRQQSPPEERKPEETFRIHPDGKISEEEVREAMLEFVKAHCCYGSRPAKQMTITTILNVCALHYQLETFTETRSVSQDHEPLYTNSVDGPRNGVAPSPWQIDVEPDELFSNHTKSIEVPHTSTVRGCHICQSTGSVMCAYCNGTGQVLCILCGGTGMYTVGYTDTDGSYKTRLQMCYSCAASGRKICLSCGGSGKITCGTCEGRRRLRWYIRLTAQFENELSDYILQKTDLPDECIRDVGGVTVFEQTLPFVWPISCHPETEINENSLRIFNHHQNSWQDRRKLQQRQRLRAVPVNEANYTWKDVSTKFWVYGNERKVYSPDYPHQCCCGCTVL